jgi:hypothetical protein
VSTTDVAARGTDGRAGTILVVWLLLALASYVVWWTLVSLAITGIRFEHFLRSLKTGAQYYLPIIAAVMVMPAVLHLFGQRLAWLWSWLFLVGSILLPCFWLLRIRAYYIEETSRGLHVEGKALFGAFANIELVGLYGAVCAVTFALASMRGGSLTRHAQLQSSMAAITLALYACNGLWGFRPFFAWMY